MEGGDASTSAAAAAATTPTPGLELEQQFYFIATGQPGRIHQSQAAGRSEETYLFTRDEACAIADAIAERETHVPFVREHAAAYRRKGEEGVATPQRAKFGHADGALVDAQDNLIFVGQTYYHAPETEELVRGINDKKWPRIGLSIGTRCREDKTTKPLRVFDKEIEHVGITIDPEFWKEGTRIHSGARSLTKFLPMVQKLMNEPGMYVPPAMRRNFERLFAHAGGGGGGGAASKSNSLAPLVGSARSAAWPAAPGTVIVTASCGVNEIMSSASSATTPPPNTETAAAPAAAAAAPPASGQQQQQQSPLPPQEQTPAGPRPLSKEQNDAIALFQKLLDAKRKEPTIDKDEYYEILKQKRALESLLDEAGYANSRAYPRNAQRVLLTAIEYENEVEAKLHAVVNLLNPVDSVGRATTHERLSDPLKQRDTIELVVASHNSLHARNTREADEKLQREIAQQKEQERIANLEAMAKQAEERAKELDGVNKRKRELEDELAQFKKPRTGGDVAAATAQANSSSSSSLLRGPERAEQAQKPAGSASSTVFLMASRSERDRCEPLPGDFVAGMSDPKLFPLDWGNLKEMYDPGRGNSELLQRFYKRAIESTDQSLKEKRVGWNEYGYH